MYTELLELAEDTVMLPPFAVTLPLCVWVVPIVTLPKFMEPGLTPRVPFVVVPEPVSETETVGSEASEVIVRVPVLVPEAAGENVTDKLALAPAANV